MNPKGSGKYLIDTQILCRQVITHPFSSICRVFYLLDVTRPRKLEVVLHEVDRTPPLIYCLDALPEALYPNFLNTPRLNLGQYQLMEKLREADVYFFTFPETIAASKITVKELDMSGIREQIMRIDEILPPLNDGISFTEFDVPQIFYARYDIVLMLSKAEQAKRSPQAPQQRLTDFLDDSVALRGDENIKNQRFEIWLKTNLESHNIVLMANKQSQCHHFISRFAKAREDFSFFPEPSKLLHHKHLPSVAVTVATNPQSPLSIDDDCECEYDDLYAASGDCKEIISSSDKVQLIANMNQTVAEVGWKALIENFQKSNCVWTFDRLCIKHS